MATARLGGEPSPRAGPGHAESSRTARLGGGASLRRQPQPQAPTVRTIYCNDREANAPVAYKVRARPAPNLIRLIRRLISSRGL